MELFDKDSPLDLVLRGFTRDYILEKTGVDVGYHASKYVASLQGIDRHAYKVAYVNGHFSREELLSFLESYAQGGLSKEEFLQGLGISAGDSGKLINLKSLFASLGMDAEFKDADKRQRKGSMARGSIEKYGVSNVFELSEFQEQAKQTRVAKYGGEYTLSKDSCLADGARQTLMCHMQDPEFAKDVADKRKATNLERYGHEGVVANPEVQKRMRERSLEKYGVEHPSQTSERRAKQSLWMRENGDRVRSKARATMRERYGADNYMSTAEGRKLQSEIMRQDWRRRFELARTTCRERYVCDFYSNTDEFKKIASDYMKQHGKEIALQARATCMERYGVFSIFQTSENRRRQSELMSDPEYQKHLAEVRRINGTERSSRLEDLLYDMLCGVFGRDDVLRQYYDDRRYPRFCDFYIKSRDLFIELNGMWTHHGHWYGSDSGDLARLDVLRATYGDDKETVNTWVVRDVEKRNLARVSNLNYVVFWDGNSVMDAVLWIAMGCPDGCDWEKMYSWLPQRVLDFSADVYCGVSAVLGERVDDILCEKAVDMWNANACLCHYGTVQSMLYAGQYKYIGKLPDELSDIEIICGLFMSGFVC